MTKARLQLSAAVRSGRTVWAAGAFDALSARLIEEAGFRALVTSGFGISSSFLGKPDVELYTMTENLTVVRNVVSAVSVPVIADIDTGYGNATNVMRTIREFETAGAAAIIIEDQVSPKQCPAVAEAVEILPIDIAIGKIEAAVSVRKDKNFLIIARTDAMSEGEALKRAKAYVAAGADLIQPISKCFRDIDGLRRLRAHCGVPLSIQLLGWLERDLHEVDIEAIAGVATHPFVALMTATQAMRDNLRTLHRERSSRSLPHTIMSQEMFSDFIGFRDTAELQQKFLRQ